MPTLTRDATVVATANQFSTFLDNEAIVLELESGTYFGLAEVGARIWELLQQPTTCQQIAATLVEEYDVSRAVLDIDVAAFVGELCVHHLVEVV